MYIVGPCSKPKVGYLKDKTLLCTIHNELIQSRPLESLLIYILQRQLRHTENSLCTYLVVSNNRHGSREDLNVGLSGNEHIN